MPLEFYVSILANPKAMLSKTDQTNGALSSEGLDNQYTIS